MFKNMIFDFVFQEFPTRDWQALIDQKTFRNWYIHYII